MGNIVKPWTATELQILREHWIPMPNRKTVSSDTSEQIAELLGRSPASVRQKAYDLGLGHKKSKAHQEYFATHGDHRPKPFTYADQPKPAQLPLKSEPTPDPTPEPVSVPSGKGIPTTADFNLIHYAETLAHIHALPIEKIQAGVTLGFYHPSLLK